MICDCGCADAGSEQTVKQVRFHGSAVESVVELCDVALEVLGLHLVVGSEQEALQVG